MALELSTQAKKDLPEWVEAFFAHIYSFTVCLADVPTARIGKNSNILFLLRLVGHK